MDHRKLIIMQQYNKNSGQMEDDIDLTKEEKECIKKGIERLMDEHKEVFERLKDE